VWFWCYWSLSQWPTGFLQCFDAVGLVIWPVKIAPEMTYKVSSGTLSLYSVLAHLLARHLLRRRVCLSVCLFVTLMYCAQTTESIIVRPSPDCSPAILVFSHQMSYMNPTARTDSARWMSNRPRPISVKPIFVTKIKTKMISFRFIKTKTETISFQKNEIEIKMISSNTNKN